MPGLSGGAGGGGSGGGGEWEPLLRRLEAPGAWLELGSDKMGVQLCNTPMTVDLGVHFFDGSAEAGAAEGSASARVVRVANRSGVAVQLCRAAFVPEESGEFTVQAQGHAAGCLAGPRPTGAEIPPRTELVLELGCRFAGTAGK